MRKILNGFIALFILAAVPTTAAPLKPENGALLAIGQDIDGLLGDTVNEGEQHAAVKVNRKGLPVNANCSVLMPKDQKGLLYRCRLTFVVKFYDPGSTKVLEKLERECFLIYRVHALADGKFNVDRSSSADHLFSSCTENLGEAP